MAGFGVKVTVTKKSSLPKLKGQANSVAIRVLNETLQNVGLATAKGLAPGSIPSQIFVIPATVEKGNKITIAVYRRSAGTSSFRNCFVYIAPNEQSNKSDRLFFPNQSG